MGWQDDQIISPAAADTQQAPWQGDPVIAPASQPGAKPFGLKLREAAKYGLFGPGGAAIVWWNDRQNAKHPSDGQSPKASEGVWGALQAGYQGSSGGLLVRGRLPDVVLDPQHAKWYHKLASGVGGTAGDLPAMIGGGIGAGVAGIETGPGALVIGGAAAFAAPTALRVALTNAYTLDQVDSVSDFLHRTAVGTAEVGGSAIVGGLTAGSGRYVGGLATPFVGKGLGKAAGVGAEVGVMTTASAALEGRLPEPDEFLNAAILVGGLHTVGAVRGKLMNIYAKTGIEPIQVVADAKADPVLMAELTASESARPISGEARTLAGSRAESVRAQLNAEADAALANPGPALESYNRDPRTAGGKIINGDIMAEVASPIVAANPVEGHQLMGEHGAANRLANDLFEQRMSQPVTEPGESVLIMVGNAATGKSTIARNNAEQYHTVLDTNGADPKGLGNAINSALSSGRQVDVLLAHADLPEAVKRNIQRQAGEGRPVSILDQANLAVNAPASFSAAAETHGSNPNVSFNASDSTPGKQAHLTGQEAIGFANGLREENRGRSTLKVATDAYTDLLRSGDARPTEAARIAFERGNEAWTDARLLEKQNGGAVLPGDGSDGSGERQVANPSGESEVGLPKRYEEAAARQAAQDAFPGEKAQQVLDNPFADMPESKLPHQLNMSYIDGPLALKSLQNRMAEVYRSDIDTARGGTQSWLETEAKAARQVADLTGVELGKIMEGRQPGDTANAVQLKIQGDILMQATVEAGGAIRDIQRAGANATDAMRTDALEKIHRLAMVQADFTGASSEVGRALNFMRSLKEIREQSAGIAKLTEIYGDDPAALLEAAAKLDTPGQLSKLARGLNKATTWDQIMEAYRASLVSGPVTQAANIISNVAFVAVRPAVDAVAASLGGPVDLFRRAAGLAPLSERVSFTEPLARVWGDLHGVLDGLKQARTAFMVDSPGGKAEGRNVIPGKAGYVVRTPFRLLTAADQVFRTMNERGEAFSLAVEKSVKEGLSPATREFRERVAELVENPTEAMLRKMEAAGRRFTFNEPIGEKAKAAAKFIRAWHLEPFVPFIATPTNVFKEMTRMTPAAPLLAEWRADVSAGGIRAQKAVAEMALGAGISALTMALAKSGSISGAGDPDPDKRQVAMAAGWQPYSVKIGNTWHSYQRIQPVGTLIGMASDLMEVWEHMTPEEQDKAPKMVGTAFANAVTNQTFLQGFSNIIGAVTEPEHKGKRFLQNEAGSLVPAVMSQTADWLDPYQRETQSMREAIQNRIPGLRNELEPKIDVFGEPITSKDRALGVSPVNRREESTDPVRREAARLVAAGENIGNAKTPNSVHLPSAFMHEVGNVPLTPEQRTVFGETAGRMAHEIMEAVIESPGWADMPDPVKARAFEQAFERGRKLARAVVLSPDQRVQEANRIAGTIGHKLAPKERD